MNSNLSSGPSEGTPPPPGTPTDAAENAPRRTVNSADLFQGAREVHIRHDEKIYRLQVTRNGKLILIK
jgi:hemin uptake protein HemP